MRADTHTGLLSCVTPNRPLLNHPGGIAREVGWQGIGAEATSTVKSWEGKDDGRDFGRAVLQKPVTKHEVGLSEEEFQRRMLDRA